MIYELCIVACKIAVKRVTINSETLTDSMKVRELIRLLSANGWVEDRCRGSHRQFKHSVRPNLLTVSGNMNADVPVGTLSAILKQTGLSKRECQ